MYKPHTVGAEVLHLPDSNQTIDIRYYGNGNHPLVLLHGAGTTPNDYENLIGNVLQRRPDFQIVAPCAPGVGESSPALHGEPIGSIAIRALEAAYVTDTDPEDVTVVGHSHGGWAAIALAEHYPDLRVGTAGTPVGEIPPTAKLVQGLLRDELRHNVHDAMHGDPTHVVKFTRQLAAAQAQSLSHPAATRERLAIIEAQMQQVSSVDEVARRRELLQSRRVIAAFFEDDATVRPPDDLRYPEMIPGSHMAPVRGPYNATAAYIVGLARAA